MQTYDVIMLVVLLSATIFGAWKGLAWQVASLGSIFLSYFVAYHLRGPVAQHIHADPPWNLFLAMLILYVASSLVIWLAFRLVSGVIDRMRLKEFDRQVGAMLGFAKGALLCIVITLFCVTLLGENQKKAIYQSRSGFYIAWLLDKAEGVLPREFHDAVHPYVDRLEPRRPTTPTWDATVRSLLPENSSSSGTAKPPALPALPTLPTLPSFASTPSAPRLPPSTNVPPPGNSPASDLAGNAAQVTPAVIRKPVAQTARPAPR